MHNPWEKIDLNDYEKHMSLESVYQLQMLNGMMREQFETFRLVKPLYISCIIQINTGDSFVSDSPYVHAFDCLEEVHHQMEESKLMDCMSKIGYRVKKTAEQILPNEKKFVRLDFGV